VRQQCARGDAVPELLPRAEEVVSPAWHERLAARLRAAVTGWPRPATA